MLEFRWNLPVPSKAEVVLRLDSGPGWLARKTLTHNGAIVFRRGWFAGAETCFRPASSNDALELRILQVPNSADWRPALFLDGVEVPEVTGAPPPRIVPPPKTLAVPVGVTYLLMFIIVAMLPQTSTMLSAFFERLDDRKVVLTVADPQQPASALAIYPTPLVSAVAGQPYAARLEAAGGTPPYTWAPARSGWPRGWILNAATGELTGTPRDAHDLFLRVQVRDSRDPNAVDAAVALVVEPRQPPTADWPAIQARSIPPATVGQEYDVPLGVTGGRSPYAWKLLGKGRLPAGLRLDAENGRIAGTPEVAGRFPLTIRVVDASYAAKDDIQRWIVPFAATIVCLLGFLAMRRWSVYIYGLLIALQAVAALAVALPIATTALVLQTVLWIVGAAHLTRMH